MLFSQQPRSIQRLLNKMRELGWGQIENLKIRGGEPILDSSTSITRDIALDREYAAKPYRPDESLKPQVRRMLEQFRKNRTGIVPVIRVQDGLPIRLRVNEKL